ncbi:MAG: M20/M25/M40 family metallo-hydrolase [Oscillospiraceae bacterium]|nr:M20/M25/M40 family metallo-hydrolase [Oscillospiraceae bacterium]
MTLLKRLTEADGLPGFEDDVRKIIQDELGGVASIQMRTDRMGNLIAEKNKGAKGAASSGGPHIALSAHMDEVGLCVRGIDSSGGIQFASWGVDARLLPSTHVRVGPNKLPGVIGTKPIHLQSAAERKSVVGIDKLFIDIGCGTKAECEKLVALGDFVAFDSRYVEFGEGKVKAKALDDRAGCAAIIEILKQDKPYRLTGVFCAQEEVGLRGSAVAANGLDADLVINIEGTVGADMEGVDENDHVTTQGAGPALSLVDRTSVYSRKYIDAIVKLADECGIPYQFRRTGAGGTDAGNFHTARGGTPCIGIAVPCRYIHSPVSVMDKGDYENLVRLVGCFIKKMNGGAIIK